MRSQTTPPPAFIDNGAGNLRTWFDPDPKHEYVIGVDCALGSGNKQSDYSAAVVFDRMTRPLEQVAELHGHYEPPAWALAVDSLRKYYGGPVGIAPTIVERNGYGAWVVKELASIDEMNLYIERDEKSQDARLMRRFGFDTNTATKPQLCGEFMKLLRAKAIHLNSTPLTDELLDMAPGGAEGAGSARTGKDDRAMACMLALWMHIHWPIVYSALPEHNKFSQLDLLSQAHRQQQEARADAERMRQAQMIQRSLAGTAQIGQRLMGAGRHRRRIAPMG